MLCHFYLPAKRQLATMECRRIQQSHAATRCLAGTKLHISRPTNKQTTTMLAAGAETTAAGYHTKQLDAVHRDVAALFRQHNSLTPADAAYIGVVSIPTGSSQGQLLSVIMLCPGGAAQIGYPYWCRTPGSLHHSSSASSSPSWLPAQRPFQQP